LLVLKGKNHLGRGRMESLEWREKREDGGNASDKMVGKGNQSEKS